MSLNGQNTLLTPCFVSFKGVDLGGTLGNVTVALEVEKADIKMDQLGTGPIDKAISKQGAKVTFEITEVRNKDNWKTVFPHMHLVTQGGNKALFSDFQIGRRDQDDAGVLVLHPLAYPLNDKSGDHTLFKAVSTGNSEIVYGPGEQAKLKAEFIIYPDFTTSPPRLYMHGDPSIGLIHAIAGTPSYVGTGNGTMTGVTASDANTVTETITARCIAPALNGGIFEVIGSVSGALGNATVGTLFTAPKSQISFTITDGSTDFIVNDEFTVAMTAANYV